MTIPRRAAPPPVARSYRAAAGVILLGYLILACAYALQTPLWQVPDEPAHLNYVAHVASDGRPPVIEAGDYPYQLLERLKAARFAGNPSIAGIEYEDHQPPLYYYLAAAVYRLRGGSLAARVRAVRLLGVVLGALTVIVAWRVAREVTPAEPALAVGTAAFVAFLPMQLTMTASVNNDALAVLLAALLLLLSLQRASGRRSYRSFAVGGGLALGAAFVTKLTVYPLAFVVLAAELLAPRAGEATPRGAWHAVARALVPLALGLALATPWFARDATVYGAGDPLGLRAHDAVVVGQERTADWIADNGLAATLGRLVSYTFKSFWGVFGWMGVFLDARIYDLLALATALAALGAVGAARRHARDDAVDGRHVTLMGLSVAVICVAFLFYNLTFVQHQGRYLFPALVPIGLTMAAGVNEWGRWLAALLGRPARGAWAGALSVAGCGAVLAALAVLSLERYVVPWLTPPS